MPERDEILVRAFSHIFLFRLCQEGLPVVELALRTENPLGFWDINGWTCCQEGSCLEFQSPRRPWTQLIHYFRSASAQWSSREVVNDCLKAANSIWRTLSAQEHPWSEEPNQKGLEAQRWWGTRQTRAGTAFWLTNFSHFPTQSSKASSDSQVGLLMKAVMKGQSLIHRAATLATRLHNFSTQSQEV